MEQLTGVVKAGLAAMKVPDAHKDVVLPEQLHGDRVNLDLRDVCSEGFVLGLEGREEGQVGVEQADFGGDVGCAEGVDANLQIKK